MGIKLFDQYSLLHFSSGIIAYFFGLKLIYWVLIHTAFEYGENTTTGMHFINVNFPFWPGGKPYADSILNSFGDSLSAAFGWIVAYLCDHAGAKYGLYPLHLKGNRIF